MLRHRSWPSTIQSWSCRSEEHTSELQSRLHLVCRLLLEKKKNTATHLRFYSRRLPRCSFSLCRRAMLPLQSAPRPCHSTITISHTQEPALLPPARPLSRL